MKKIILSTIMVLAFTLSNAQWKQGEYVDNFGDKTGEKYEYITTTGKFSNSATTNSSCGFTIIKSNNSIGIKIYPYNRNHVEEFTYSSNQSLGIKSPDGYVHWVDILTGSGIIIQKKHFEKFNDILKKPGLYKFNFNYHGEYSLSSYSFNLTIK